MLNWWQDFWSGMLDAAPHWRLQWSQLRAARLERKGRLEDALAAAADALTRTLKLGPSADYALPFVTIAYDRIARKLGKPGVSSELIDSSLRVCRAFATKSPRLAAKLQEHIAWFEWRQAQPPTGPGPSVETG